MSSYLVKRAATAMMQDYAWPSSLSQADAERLAEAALRRLREPTGDTILACWGGHITGEHLHPRKAWLAMMDHVLTTDIGCGWPDEDGAVA